MSDENAFTSDLDADVMGIPVWLLGLIAVAGFFVIKHFLSGSSSAPVAIPVTTPSASYSPSPSASYGSSPTPSSSGGGAGPTGATGFAAQSPIAQWVTEFQNAVSALNLNDTNATDALANYLAGNTITSSAQRTTLQAVLSVVGPAPGIGAPQYGPPPAPQPQGVIGYTFSNPGGVPEGNPIFENSGFTVSTNPQYLGLANPAQLQQAVAEGYQIYWEPTLGQFVPVGTHQLLPNTTLYAHMPGG